MRVNGRNDAFVWRHGRADVTLTREGDQWKVVYAAVGRLLGPRQTIYENQHRRADLAAWDFMARVIQATHNETLGVQVACDAARWMSEKNTPAND